MYDKWLTKEQDLRNAEEIIFKHLELNEGGPLGIFEVHIEESADLRISDWVVEIADFFYEKYGSERGDFVTKKVLSTCLINGQPIH